MGLLPANINILTSCLARPYCSVRHSEVDILFLLTFLQVCALGITPSVNWSIFSQVLSHLLFLGGTSSVNPPADAGDTGDASPTPGSGRFPGEWKGNPLQYSWLENRMDREAWQATIQGVRHDWMTERAHPFLWCMTWHVHNNIHLGNIHNNFQIPGLPITVCI